METSILQDFIRSKCNQGEVLTSDFPEEVRQQLRELSFFEALQAIHRFAVSDKEKVNNRIAYFVGIVRATQNWWAANQGIFNLDDVEAGKYKTRLSASCASSICELCINKKFDPIYLAPSVCDALCSVNLKQAIRALEKFVEIESAYDGAYAKQELLVHLIHNMPLQQAPNGSRRAQSLRMSYNGPERIDRLNATILESMGMDVLNVTNKPLTKTWADTISNGTQSTKQQRNSSPAWFGDEHNDQYTNENGIIQKPTETPETSTEGQIKMVDVNMISEEEAKRRLPLMLNAYILSKCNANEHCRKSDFDGTAREALSRISFLQALQAIEHFASSVSNRIQKRPAYLMGILRGQEGHWDKSRAAAQLEGGSSELLALPSRVLLQIAQLCLEGNCLPSDFTPEVCLALHRLSPPLALKALHAFNSNKRIVAGCRGGVLNRARFFQRLIQNVAEQNLINGGSASDETSVDLETADGLMSVDNGNGNYFDQKVHQEGGSGAGNTKLMKEDNKLGDKISKSSPPIRRAVSLSLDESPLSPHSPSHNAWASQLASATIAGGSWGLNSAPSSPSVSPARSMSIDNSQFAPHWAHGDSSDIAYSSGNAPDEGSSPSTSMHESEIHSAHLMSGPQVTSRDVRDSRIVGSPINSNQRGWEASISRHGSSSSVSSQTVLSPSLANGSVIGWNSSSSAPSSLHQQVNSGSRSIIGDAPDVWSQPNDIEFGMNAKPFTSLFSPSPNQRSNTPTSQLSASSPRNHKQQQLQPQDEEPDTLSENSTSGLLEIGQLRNIVPEERADILEIEVKKLTKQLRAYEKRESNLLAELMQAKARIRLVESEYAKLNKDYVALGGGIRQEVMVAVAQSLDRILQRGRSSSAGDETELAMHSQFN